MASPPDGAPSARPCTDGRPGIHQRHRGSGCRSPHAAIVRAAMVEALGDALAQFVIGVADHAKDAAHAIYSWNSGQLVAALSHPA